MRLVYIMGLGHSGSTFLEYVLCSLNGVLGLGEFENLYVNAESAWVDGSPPAPRCSCGMKASECSFWAQLMPAVDENKAMWYKRCIRHVREYDKSIHTVIDTSKTGSGLTNWIRLYQEGVVTELSLILLYRDPRGWVVSEVKNRKRKSRPSKHIVSHFIHWQREYSRFFRFIRGTDCRTAVVSYDELVFNHDKQKQHIIRKIFATEGLATTPSATDRPLVHDVYGNRMKVKAWNKLAIKYDSDWLYSVSPNFLAFMVPGVWPLFAALRSQSEIR